MPRPPTRRSRRRRPSRRPRDAPGRPRKRGPGRLSAPSRRRGCEQCPRVPDSHGRRGRAGSRRPRLQKACGHIPASGNSLAKPWILRRGHFSSPVAAFWPTPEGEDRLGERVGGRFARSDQGRNPGRLAASPCRRFRRARTWAGFPGSSAGDRILWGARGNDRSVRPRPDCLASSLPATIKAYCLDGLRFGAQLLFSSRRPFGVDRFGDLIDRGEKPRRLRDVVLRQEGDEPFGGDGGGENDRGDENRALLGMMDLAVSSSAPISGPDFPGAGRPGRGCPLKSTS